MKRTFLPLFSSFVFGGIAQAGLVLSEVDLVNNKVEIINTGSTAEDLTGHWFCNLWQGSPVYVQILASQIVAGESSVSTLNMPPGALVTIQSTTSFITDMRGELGLYKNGNNFGDANNMTDYLAWGGDAIRDSTAATLGIWGNATSVSVTGIAAGQTIQLKQGEDGNAFTDYELAVSTIGINQVIPPVPDPKIVSISRNAGGDVVIAFTPGGAGFILTSSNDLASPFAPETNAVQGPPGTFTVPVAFLNPGRDFFRVVKP
ncbi:hypothetical protein OJ996_11330 [Luteolibacter sp. GHJ8]|uniref:Uncharacterized protein n=1 Tax=Luteolibacter rhizosphaerae TaxID=2989719 RepID=A0ABT3G2V5_9BACT|nr:hypothetical protein [Luteolibacter rhizosphaerae]MCW1914171.1 hypothetical protein [Luteolibacter rhizosphaerae]